MMKRLITVLCFVAAALAGGCISLGGRVNDPERVSADEFKKHFADMGVIHSTRRVTFLGVRDGIALIKVQSMAVTGSHWNERIVFVPLDELDAEFRRAITREPNPESSTRRVLFRRSPKQDAC